jgi:hypothetical protein
MPPRRLRVINKLWSTGSMRLPEDDGTMAMHGMAFRRIAWGKEGAMKPRIEASFSRL